MQIIKEFYGFSGSKVVLIQDQDQIWVRKYGIISRNLERLEKLSTLNIQVPSIINQNNDFYDMEYVQGLDMKNYLENHDHTQFEKFLIDLFFKLSKNSIEKDYTSVYREKLKKINFDNFIFNEDELLDALPKILPCSNYHGDLSLDNIIYNKNRGFVLIDPLTSEFDSFIFDISKIRQDLELGWFIRNHRVSIEVKLKLIQEEIINRYPLSNNKSLLILMLLRVLPYAKECSFEKKFLIQGINKLWR